MARPPQPGHVNIAAMPTPVPPTPPQPRATTPTAHPWRWIPTLYFAQGLPYVVVMTLAVVMYKNLEIGRAHV